MEKENFILDGAIEVGEKNTDFLIGDIGENLPELEMQDDEIHEYNQGQTNDCTIYGSMGALSDLMNYHFSAEEIKEMNEISYTKGRIRGRGRYTKSAVDLVRNYRNEKNPNNKVISLKINIGDETFKEAFGKKYTIVTTYKGNSAYNVDYYKDLVLNGTDFPNPTYGHCNSIFMGTIKKLDEGTYVKDSYLGYKKNGKSLNIYKLKDLPGLVRDGTYYPACYIFVKENSLKRKQEEIKRLSEFRRRIEQNIENNSAMRNLTNDDFFKDILHKTNTYLRNKLKDIDNELSKNN